MERTRFVFSCEDCKHYKDGKCDQDFEIDQFADAYDCTGFEDENPVWMLKVESMEFEELKQIVIDSIDEAKTPIDLMQIIVKKVYEKGVEDGKNQH